MNEHPRLARRNRLTSATRLLARRVATGGTVLTYHGTRRADGPSSSTMHVSPERLTATLRAVAAVATYVPLGELVQRHLGGKSTRGLVAVTFDDAYASVVEQAWGAIQALEIPTTLFVVSDAARTQAPFWWDRIESLFDATSQSRWRSFEEACGLPATFRAGQPPDAGPLRPLRQWVLAEHRGVWPLPLADLVLQLELELDRCTTQHPLGFHELDRLTQSPLVDIGVHTASHPVLPLLSDAEKRGEIRTSFRVLAERYERTLRILAPPFGLYDRQTVAVAKEEGLTACLSLEAMSLHDRTPDGMIPRYCMSARHRPWKGVLYALGWWRNGQRRGRGTARYPALPSATT